MYFDRRSKTCTKLVYLSSSHVYEQPQVFNKFILATKIYVSHKLKDPKHMLNTDEQWRIQELTDRGRQFYTHPSLLYALEVSPLGSFEL